MAADKERRTPKTETKPHIVHKGQLSLGCDETALLGICGSSVVVCLWDRDTLTGGMCNYQYPSTHNKELAKACYGNVALLTMLKKMGYEKSVSHFEAHIIGAADDGKGTLNLENITIAYRVLASYGIPVVSEDIGGTKGRKVIFDIKTGHVAVVKVHKLREEDWSD